MSDSGDNLTPGPGLQRYGPDSETIFVSSFIAGTNVTAKNGGTHVIPGSHKWPQDRSPTQEETVPVEMKKGSCAFWLGSTFHGAVSIIPRAVAIISILNAKLLGCQHLRGE